jgi:hypothetical protein
MNVKEETPTNSTTYGFQKLLVYHIKLDDMDDEKSVQIVSSRG